MNYELTLVIQTMHFDKRLCWMLSSLLQQNTLPPPCVHISYLGGSPTERVIEEFRAMGLLTLTKTYWSVSKLQRRGLTRSVAIKRAQTPWLLFTDSDMVYHPEFFGRLHEWMKARPAFDGVGKAGRWSNTIDRANNLVNHIDGYPKEIRNAWKYCDTGLDKIRKANVGAGYFQLINVDHCPHDWYYVTAEECKDGLWTGTGQKARSDQQFRKRIGKTVALPKWFSEHQIHLNHNRDSMFKKHITEER